MTMHFPPMPNKDNQESILVQQFRAQPRNQKFSADLHQSSFSSQTAVLPSNEPQSKAASSRPTWQICLLGLTIGILLGGVALGTAVTMWLTASNSTTTQSTSSTSTSSSSSSTSTSSTSESTTSTTTAPPCPPQTYSQSFTTSVAATTAQCSVWNTFRASLSCGNYTQLTFSGSQNPVGHSVVDPVVVNTLALALVNGVNSGLISSNGTSWATDTCGSGLELTIGSVCSCAAIYAVRPCIANSNWGGLNSTTCSAATQTFTVAFS